MSLQAIEDLIGEPTSERVRFVLDRAKSSDNPYNCTTAAQYLLGVPKSRLNEHIPMGIMWANNSSLVFLKQEGYESIPGVEENEIKHRAGYCTTKTGRIPLVNFGDGRIMDLTDLAIQRTHNGLETNALNSPSARWEAVQEVVDQEDVLSVFSYRINTSGRLMLDEYHHSTVIRNKNQYFLLEKWHASGKGIEIKEISSNGMEQIKHFKNALYLLAVGGENMPPTLS